MKLLAHLLSKDLKRAWRNPVAFVVNLAVPLLITALIGLAFGGSSRTGTLGRIKLAIVDEDDSPVSQFLRGAVNQGKGAKYIEPIFLPRAEAMQQIADGKISAVVVLPRDFTRDYFTSQQPVILELIKNPAQSFYPAIIEELLRVLTTALNAVQRNFRPEMAGWQALFESTNRPSPRAIAELVVQTGERIEAARGYLFPPLISYMKTMPKPEDKGEPGRPPAKPAPNPVADIFRFILPGMAAMFLLFIADNAVRDLYREQRFQTFQRFRTLHHGLFIFIGGKVVFAMAILLISSLILFGGGSVIFRFDWQNPIALMMLAVAYALFASGFMSLIASLAGTERRADTLNTIIAMGMGLTGGCMFPREQLPSLLGNHITPWMPTFWFADAVRLLHTNPATRSWLLSAVMLAGLGMILVALAAWIFQQRLQQGARS